MFDTGPLYLANRESKADVCVNQGGTSSGKTYAILQVIFDKAVSEKCVITVAGQDIPNLKVGAIRDANEIVDNSETLQQLLSKPYNKSDRYFSFKSGSIIEFKSYDDAQDAKSGKRNYLFINEANGIPYEVYHELSIRTNKQTFIDYNPNAQFWVHDKVIGKPNTQLFITDHRHNPFCGDKIREKIEALKDIDLELWKVYGRGLTGKISGLVLSNWEICERIPQDAKRIGTGLDFGFTNDPTAVIDLYMQNGDLYIDELLYETGLTNQDIFNALRSIGFNMRNDVIADSSEPKSIVELQRLGMRVEAAKKGPDSVKAGIGVLKSYKKIYVTRRSVNFRKELLNYKWKVDHSTGNATNDPIDAFNHGFDALRYIALNRLLVKRSPLKGSF